MDHPETLALLEEAANSADFDRVAPLIADDAVYSSFTDGTFEGLDEVRHGFQETWVRTIRHERYRIELP